MIDAVYKSFGFSYRACLSGRPGQFLGDEAVWNISESILENALKKHAVSYSIDPGGGAFYGPKIGIEIKDSKDKWWQVATVQLDFNLPERFDLKYIDVDGSAKRPVVIHLALYGAIERFMGIYLEHVQGNLPLKLAPQQVRIYPIADRHQSYAAEVKRLLKECGIRAVLDDCSESLGSKLREGRRFRAPYSIVIGDKELSSRSLAVSERGKSDSRQMMMEAFVGEVKGGAEFEIG